MKPERFVPFEITSIDALGQGVSKITDKVVFIPKTTIGDKGEARIMSEKKGVVFARVSSMSSTSSERITPLCPHFSQCHSCHFLHVEYEQELRFKKESFVKLFRKLPLPEVEVIGAPDRFSYRNRIQLHYSLKTKLLGMKDPQTFEIIPIPDCLIGREEIKKELKRLYANGTWISEAPKNKTEGHVEIYLVNGSLQTSWNRPYADGGFTQVFEEMNHKLKEILSSHWRTSSAFPLLDLFGGNGNLSNDLNYSERLCVDYYTQKKGSEFFSQDLYDEKALSQVVRELKKRNLSITHLLLDPPRSGLKNLKVWVDALSPSKIAYVSCDPHTLARDLSTLEGYRPMKSFLIDFFPSTFHFESLIFLERKE